MRHATTQQSGEGADRLLHHRDRPAWIAQHAPGCGAKLLAYGPATLRIAWDAMGEDYKEAVRKHLTRDQRAQFRAALAETETTA